jgi:hypothetical protein
MQSKCFHQKIKTICDNITNFKYDVIIDVKDLIYIIKVIFCNTLLHHLSKNKSSHNNIYLSDVSKNKTTITDVINIQRCINVFDFLEDKCKSKKYSFYKILNYIKQSFSKEKEIFVKHEKRTDTDIIQLDYSKNSFSPKLYINVNILVDDKNNNYESLSVLKYFHRYGEKFNINIVLSLSISEFENIYKEDYITQQDDATDVEGNKHYLFNVIYDRNNEYTSEKVEVKSNNSYILNKIENISKSFDCFCFNKLEKDMYFQNAVDFLIPIKFNFIPTLILIIKRYFGIIQHHKKR